LYDDSYQLIGRGPTKIAFDTTLDKTSILINITAIDKTVLSNSLKLYIHDKDVQYTNPLDLVSDEDITLYLSNQEVVFGKIYETTLRDKGTYYMTIFNYNRHINIHVLIEDSGFYVITDDFDPDDPVPMLLFRSVLIILVFGFFGIIVISTVKLIQKLFSSRNNFS
jgi:hypothetical protein